MTVIPDSLQSSELQPPLSSHKFGRKQASHKARPSAKLAGLLVATGTHIPPLSYLYHLLR